jgi:hypothetical protein
MKTLKMVEEMIRQKEITYKECSYRSDGHLTDGQGDLADLYPQMRIIGFGRYAV